ncbi:Membrane proteinase PrsW, cleaves anti-sigma factor RsiW, M82 family [Marininema mesophilum]|uniref:Membrane proteinase PrsW, cleaves anti-sigma factor RsiW, M82 family n=1 Tax=Marininema mesophilum TaxID=1048340 RepID=A0A1H3BU20_9BACL|nr:PrsW family glutamic-type intramembrane protease [Marininema mesophilum]SDX45542.1 Membrane proteinase PrsW, cleaves anti-sigma factor RsiW, M82 family [Marininema mesophilum]
MLESMRQLGMAFLMYWKDRRERWVTRHTDLLRRIRKVYITLAWIFIPLAILAAIFFPQVREAFTQFLWSYYLLWQFWFLSRSKTLTWTGMARFFAVGAWIIAPLSALFLYGVHTLFAEGSATIQADWSSVVVGPIMEETIKLLPFLLIFCFTRRSQTFSLTDYMLVGGATGVGFDFMEEMVRRWVATDSGGLIGYFFRLFSESDDSWQVFTLFPGTNESGGAISVDHGVWTAFVTLAIGISIRMKNRWGKKGFLFPLFVYLWATFDHSSWNDQNPGPWKDLLHTLLGQGHFYLWSFVIVLLVAVWMDFRRLNLVRHQLPLLPKEQVIEPIFEFLTIIQSLFRGRQAWGQMMLFTRERRHYGFTLLQEKDELFPDLGDLRVSLQQRFLFLGGVFATLLVLGLSSGLLSHFTITDAYFAGLFDQLSDWWQGLNGWEKGGIIAGMAVIGGVLTVATGGGFLAGGMTALGAALTANDVLQSPIPIKSFMNDPMGATKQWTRELLKKPPQEAVNTVFTLAADQLLRRVPALRAGNELMDLMKSRVQRSARNWMPGRSVVDAGTGMRMRADWDRHDWNQSDYRESRAAQSETNQHFQAGTPEHKAKRWEEYQERGGNSSYESWSNKYEANMRTPVEAHKIMNEYWKRIGWGKREVTVDAGGVSRRLDIADLDLKKGIEHKTTTLENGRGYFSLRDNIRSEIERDAYLVKRKKWDITWVFENADASEPLLQELKKNGLKYKIVEKGGV